MKRELKMRAVITKVFQGHRLTERQMTYLILATKGYTHKDIANFIGMSEKGVKFMLYNSFKLIGAKGTKQFLSRVAVQAIDGVVIKDAKPMPQVYVQKKTPYIEPEKKIVLPFNKKLGSIKTTEEKRHGNNRKSK